MMLSITPIYSFKVSCPSVISSVRAGVLPTSNMTTSLVPRMEADCYSSVIIFKYLDSNINIMKGKALKLVCSESTLYPHLVVTFQDGPHNSCRLVFLPLCNSFLHGVVLTYITSKIL